MSVFAFLAALAFDDGNDEVGVWLCGPLMWAWIIIGGSCYKLWHWFTLCHFRKNYIAVMFYHNGYRWDTYYIHKAAIGLFKTKEDAGENAEYYTEIIKDCTKAKQLPFKQYIIDKTGKRRKNLTEIGYLDKWKKGN
jgi:hypothetical protein